MTLNSLNIEFVSNIVRDFEVQVITINTADSGSGTNETDSIGRGEYAVSDNSLLKLNNNFTNNKIRSLETINSVSVIDSAIGIENKTKRQFDSFNSSKMHYSIQLSDKKLPTFDSLK